MDYFIDMVKDKFICIKAFDGCLADMILKPITNQSDEWIGIQVKSTAYSQMGYGFHLDKKNYENMLILCICDLDSRMWLIPHEDVKHLQKLTIGRDKSKYNKYEITKDNWCTKVKDYFNYLPKFPFETLDTPQGIYTQREKAYRLKREQNAPFIKFDYPYLEGQVYDFMCNGLKIQEKVGGKGKGRNGYRFSLWKSNGYVEDKVTFTSYKIGDNDMYWLHCEDAPYFYVIPENALVENKKINRETKQMLYILPERKEMWYSPYRFDYDNLDKEKLEKMFHKR